MNSKVTISSLPAELLLAIFTAQQDMSDVLNLAYSQRCMYSIWRANYHCISDMVLSKNLSCFSLAKDLANAQVDIHAKQHYKGLIAWIRQDYLKTIERIFIDEWFLKDALPVKFERKNATHQSSSPPLLPWERNCLIKSIDRIFMVIRDALPMKFQQARRDEKTSSLVTRILIGCAKQNLAEWLAKDFSPEDELAVIDMNMDRSTLLNWNHEGDWVPNDDERMLAALATEKSEKSTVEFSVAQEYIIEFAKVVFTADVTEILAAEPVNNDLQLKGCYCETNICENLDDYQRLIRTIPHYYANKLDLDLVYKLFVQEAIIKKKLQCDEQNPMCLSHPLHLTPEELDRITKANYRIRLIALSYFSPNLRQKCEQHIEKMNILDVYYMHSLTLFLIEWVPREDSIKMGILDPNPLEEYSEQYDYLGVPEWWDTLSQLGQLLGVFGEEETSVPPFKELIPGLCGCSSELFYGREHLENDNVVSLITSFPGVIVDMDQCRI